MSNSKTMVCRMAVLALALGTCGVISGFTQDAPDVGPHPRQPMKNLESHVGNLTGHAKDAKSDYRRYCAGCHGDLGDGNGENAQWLDPKTAGLHHRHFQVPIDSDRHVAHRR